MGKIIAFSNQKGGVGKTTTCVNLTANLATRGYKCLIVDIDPQGNATSGLGFDKGEIKDSKRSLYDVIVGGVSVKNATLLSDTDNLYLLPSSVDLAGAEVELANVERDRERILRRILESVRDEYDYIMIDCPPALGLLTVNALTAADEVIIPVQTEFYAMEGLSQLVNTIKIIKAKLNSKLSINGVLLTMCDPRALIAKQIAEEIKKYFPKITYETPVPRNVRLAEAPSHGKPISVYDKSCKGAKAYSLITDEFLARETEENK